MKCQQLILSEGDVHHAVLIRGEPGGGGGLLGDQLNHSVTQADTFNMYVSQQFYTVHKTSNLNHNKQQSVPVYEFVLSFNSSPPSRQDRMSSTTTLRVTQ